MEGPNGRNQGITVWDNLADDKFKYFGGVYGIDQGGPNLATPPPGANPFYSARLSYTFQGSEPGYFGSSTYYGEKSVTTLGLGGQYQKDGSNDTVTGAPKDTFIGMVDLLTEQAVSGAGTFTFEGQFYGFNKGYQFSGPGTFSPHEAFYALFSYLTPENVGHRQAAAAHPLAADGRPRVDHHRRGARVRHQGVRRSPRPDLRAHRHGHDGRRRERLERAAVRRAAPEVDLAAQ